MTRLSNRQYPMLQLFHDLKAGEFLSIDDAQAYDQRPFRSMLIRKWISYRAGRGFHITREGREAWNEFLTTDISRKNPSRPLTAYFDPTAYGLAKKKVVAMPRRGAAARDACPAAWLPGRDETSPRLPGGLVAGT